MVFNTEKQLKEFGDKIPTDKKTAIEEAAKRLKEAHTNKDMAGIDVAMTDLNNAWQAASQEMYNAQGGEQPQPPGQDPNANQGQSPQDGEVTDVDFEEVK
jgi:molecular chaperone DnaK